ncbi:MAG: hypothetical protein O3C20_19820 [Verrucomicrobia bacterium]|nr:hypothetical protein [Verrucomicrobiota bacterium]
MFLQAVSGFFRLALPVLAIIALTSGSSHACEIDWEVDPAVDCQEELENENKEESVNMINGGRNCPKSADTLSGKSDQKFGVLNICRPAIFF